MRALILSAGKGTRLGLHARGFPKPLVPLGEYCSLIHQLKKLEGLGVSEVIVNTHQQHELFVETLNAVKFKLKVHLHNESELLGTGGTLKLHIAWLAQSNFWVLHADNFFYYDLNRIKDTLSSTSPEIAGVMGSFKTLNFKNVGILKTNRHRVVEKIHEKKRFPHGLKGNAAIYFFKPTIVEYINELKDNENDLSNHLIPKLLGKMKVVPLGGHFIDIGTPRKFRQAVKAAQSLSDKTENRGTN